MELQEVIDILELHRTEMRFNHTDYDFQVYKVLEALDKAIHLLRDHHKWNQIIGEFNSVGNGYPVFVEDLKKVLEKESEE